MTFTTVLILHVTCHVHTLHQKEWCAGVCSRGPDSSDKMSPVFPVPVPAKWEHNSVCAAPAAGISYLSNLCCNEGSGEPQPRL